MTKIIYSKHFLYRSYVARKYKCHLHTNRSQLMIMIEEDHLHIIEKGAVQEKYLLAHRTLMFHPRRKYCQYKPNIFPLGDRICLITDVQKPKYLICSRRTLCFKVSNAF